MRYFLTTIFAISLLSGFGQSVKLIVKDATPITLENNGYALVKKENFGNIEIRIDDAKGHNCEVYVKYNNNKPPVAVPGSGDNATSYSIKVQDDKLKMLDVIVKIDGKPSEYFILKQVDVDNVTEDPAKQPVLHYYYIGVSPDQKDISDQNKEISSADFKALKFGVKGFTTGNYFLHIDGTKNVVQPIPITTGRNIDLKSYTNDIQSITVTVFSGAAPVPGGSFTFTINDASAANDRSSDTDTTDDNADQFGTMFGGLLSYNFVNKTSWKGLMPELQGGFSHNTKTLDVGKKSTLGLSSNFILSSASYGLVDSGNYLAALMLPGTFNMALGTSPIFVFNKEAKKESAVFMTIATGLKVITGIKESKGAIVQGNLKLGLGLKISDFFSITATGIFGWHNLSTDQEDNFRTLFNKPVIPGQRGNNTAIQYLVLQGQFKVDVNRKDAEPLHLGYLFIDYRAANRAGYFDFKPQAFFTIGFRKTFDFSTKQLARDAQAMGDDGKRKTKAKKQRATYTESFQN